MTIYKILQQWKEEAKLPHNIIIQYRYRNRILSIYTSHPGLLIGRQGILVDKYTEIFKEHIYDFNELEFIEVSEYWI